MSSRTRNRVFDVYLAEHPVDVTEDGDGNRRKIPSLRYRIVCVCAADRSEAEDIAVEAGEDDPEVLSAEVSRDFFPEDHSRGEITFSAATELMWRDARCADAKEAVEMLKDAC